MSSIERFSAAPASEARNGYCSVVKAGPFYFIGGITGSDPDTDQLDCPYDAVRQAKMIYQKRLAGIFEDHDLKPSQVVEETVYLTSWDNAAEVMEARRSFYAGAPKAVPATAGVQVSSLATPGVVIEVKLIVYVGVENDATA